MGSSHGPKVWDDGENGEEMGAVQAEAGGREAATGRQAEECVTVETGVSASGECPDGAEDIARGWAVAACTGDGANGQRHRVYRPMEQPQGDDIHEPGGALLGS